MRTTTNFHHLRLSFAISINLILGAPMCMTYIALPYPLAFMDTLWYIYLTIHPYSFALL
jgi:hypothetical protein